MAKKNLRSGVRIYEQDEIKMAHTYEPLNPHPPFPQWAQWDVYPYQFMGSIQLHRVKKTFRMVYLENEFLKVCVAPDIGGRIWFIYDKISRRHAINYATEVWMYNAGFGLNYTIGGLEVNYPLAHACTTSRQREYQTVRNPDGSASVIIGEYEQIWRTRWFIKYTLRPGRSFLEQTVRIYNRSLHDSRYMYWANCGLFVNDDVQFIFPEKTASMHGQEIKIFSWPIWKQKDISYWKNVTEALGLYMLEAEEPYFGYYDYGNNYGFVHYGDLADLPGKKYWSWGAQYSGRILAAKQHHPENKPYGEMQAGRIVIQEHLDRVPPETESQWTEYWYPVRDIGVFNGVGKDAALKAEINLREDGKTHLAISAIGSGTFPNAQVIVICGKNKPIKKGISLNPVSRVECKVDLPYRPKEKEDVIVTITNQDNEILAKTKLREPSKRDSWTEVVTMPEGLKPASAEEIFMEGESLARDWGNHDERKKYEEALTLDPGFSYAHQEIGKIDTFRGNYASAIEHFKKAIQRNYSNLDSYYSLGVALILNGKPEEACRVLEKSARYDTEARSRTRLAEIKIREGDLHQALRYLNRVVELAPRLTRPLGLNAACLRHLVRLKEADQVIRKACQSDPMDPFSQMERILIDEQLGTPPVIPASRKRESKLKRLLKQIRMAEPPYLEAVFDYGNVGFFDDALQVLKMFPQPGPIAALYQAYLEHKSGNEKKAESTLADACKLTPVGHNVWRLEMIPVLEWAIEVEPEKPRPYYYLGNLMVARRRLDEGVKLWHKAEILGEKCYLFYSGLGYYESKIVKNPTKALNYFQKALELEPEDPYMNLEVFAALKQCSKSKEAIEYLEKDLSAVKVSPRLAGALMSEYIERKEYKKVDALVSRLDFSTEWQYAPVQVWSERYIREALEFMAKKRYKMAIDLLSKSTKVPDNLGFILPDPDFEPNERMVYHLGCCYKKIGDEKKARELWEKVVNINRTYAWEPANWYNVWNSRYFVALALKKLNRENEANIVFDGMELLTKISDIPEDARKYIMNLIVKGRFAEEGKQDPYEVETVQVAAKAEL